MGEERKRRWFRFSLRTLLAFVLLVSIAMSWIGLKLQRAKKQREARHAIEKAGGGVEYELFVQSPVPRWKEWAHANLGDGLLFDATAVWGGNTDFGNNEMAHLKRLPKLSTVFLEETQVTDAGLEHLEGMTNLSILDLRSTEVTDAGLEHLKGLIGLSFLFLGETHVTGAGLEHLQGLNKLGILDLGGTQVGDAGLEHLQGMTELTELRLEDTQVTDAGLEYLKGLTNLTLLDLSGTQVTDAGLVHLKGLTNLEFLLLGDSQVDAPGVESLSLALPDCYISAKSRSQPQAMPQDETASMPAIQSADTNDLFRGGACPVSR